jgi:O-antigen ligase
MRKLSELSDIFKAYPVRTWLLLFVGISLFLPNGVNSLSIIILFLHWLFFVPNSEKSDNFKRKKKYLFLLLSFYLINALSLIYTADFDSGIFDLQVKLSLFVFPIIMLCQRSVSVIELKKILYLFSICVAFFSCLAVTLSFVKFGRLSANQQVANLIGLHASYYSLFVALSIYVIIDIFMNKKNKLIHYFILALFLLVISILASRSVLISLFLMTIIWFSIVQFNKKTLVFSALAFLGITIFGLSYEPIKNRLYEAIDSKDIVELDAPINEHRTLGKTFGGRAIRVAIWKCSADIVKENWLTGVGTGDAQNELQESYKNHGFEFAYLYNRYNAHNLFIQTCISSGIFGLLSIISILIFLVYISVKMKSIVSFAFSVLFIFISLVESSLNVQSGVVFFALFSGIFISHFFYFQSTLRS